MHDNAVMPTNLTYLGMSYIAEEQLKAPLLEQHSASIKNESRGIHQKMKQRSIRGLSGWFPPRSGVREMTSIPWHHSVGLTDSRFQALDYPVLKGHRPTASGWYPRPRVDNEMLVLDKGDQMAKYLRIVGIQRQRGRLTMTPHV